MFFTSRNIHIAEPGSRCPVLHAEIEVPLAQIDDAALNALIRGKRGLCLTFQPDQPESAEPKPITLLTLFDKLEPGAMFYHEDEPGRAYHVTALHPDSVEATYAIFGRRGQTIFNKTELSAPGFHRRGPMWAAIDALMHRIYYSNETLHEGWKQLRSQDARPGPDTIREALAKWLDTEGEVRLECEDVDYDGWRATWIVDDSKPPEIMVMVYDQAGALVSAFDTAQVMSWGETLPSWPGEDAPVAEADSAEVEAAREAVGAEG